MMSPRAGALLVGLLVISVALAGCHGLEDDDDSGATPSPTPTPTATADPNATASPSPSPTATPEPAGPSITITVVDAPDNVTVDDTVTLHIEVEGDNVTATTAEVAYAYNSTAGISDDELTLDLFNGTVDGDGNMTFPGNYTIVDWTIEDERDLYIRAHIVVDGDSYWSGEEAIAVNPPDADPPTGKIWQMNIGGFPANGFCDTAMYNEEESDAEEITIGVGDKVFWVNREGNAFSNCPTGNDHTATSTSVPDGASAFDTGPLAPADSSEEIQFLVAGTYTYECSFHPTTMTGITITVE